MENDKNEFKDFSLRKRLPRPLFYFGLIIGMSIFSQMTIPRFPKNDKDLNKARLPTLSVMPDKTYEEVK